MEQEIYIASCAATKQIPTGICVRHRALVVKAFNEDEATGIAYRVLIDKIAQVKDGWGNHGVVVDRYSEMEVTT